MELSDNQTASVIEKRMLSNVSESFDRREGSLIYDATAPASIELAEAYIMMDTILEQTFATTASREYLILRAAEFNIVPEEATYAIAKAQFNMAVPIGSRFNSGSLNFAVTALVDDTEHTYLMTCETAGTEGNKYTGKITPITTVNGLTSAEIISIEVPGEDDEDTEVFRKRYFAALKSQAYGGNGADYKEKCLAQNGVGGVKVYRCWNGGGTVKCVIQNTEYGAASNTLVGDVQEVLDPNSQGKGYGLAPIGHTVTVASVSELKINVSATLTLQSGYDIEDYQSKVETAIQSYLLAVAEGWGDLDENESLVVRVSGIETAILAITGIVDIIDTMVNGSTTRIALGVDDVPIMGDVTLKKEA